MNLSRNDLRSWVVTALVLAFSVVTAAAQTSWTTEADIRSGVRGRMVGTVRDIGTSSRFQLVPDSEQSYGAVAVNADSLVTQYLGFSDSSTSSDTLTGPAGFSKLREGDRVEVRGVGGSNRSISAEQVTLLGRSLSSGVGVGVGASGGRLEGVIRQISQRDNSLTLETDSRQMLTVTGSTNTPVYYRGETFQFSNLEVGDRIRVDASSTSGGAVRARSIDVLINVQESGGGRRLTTVNGRITQVDTRAQTLRLDTSRERGVRVDVRRANDSSGRAVRLADLRVGDRIAVTGDYDTAGVLRATTLRIDDGLGDRDEPSRSDDRYRNEDDSEPSFGDYSSVTLYGVVDASLDDDDVLVLKESGNNRIVRVLVDDDFIVKTKSGGYAMASSLKKGDRVSIKALKDSSDRHIAQTIRYR